MARTFNSNGKSAEAPKAAPVAEKKAFKSDALLKFRDVLNKKEDYEILTGLKIVRGKKDPNKIYLMGNTIVRGADGKGIKDASGKYEIDTDFLMDLTPVLEKIQSGDY